MMKLFKIFLILIIITLSIFSFSTVQASSINNILSGIKDFEDSREDISNNSVTGEMEINTSELKQISDLVYNSLLIIGIVVAVIIGLILGMKFMTGSINQKSEVKQALIPYIVGCIIIFSAFGIWKLVVTILNDTEPSSITAQVTQPQTQQLTLNKSSLVLTQDNSESLQVTSFTNNQRVIWKTSNSDVATVSTSGLVTAKSVGSAVISAQLESQIATCNVTVHQKVNNQNSNQNSSSQETSNTTQNKNVSTLLSTIESYSEQIQKDYKTGRYWEYSNNNKSKGEKQTYNSFEDAKNGQRTTNCARIVFWAFYDMGITLRKEDIYSNASGELKAKNSTKQQMKKYVDIIRVNKTPNQLKRAGNLKPGDICLYPGHTNIYIGNNKWYDAGRGSGIGNAYSYKTVNGNAIYRFKTVGPCKSSYVNHVATYIIRLKDQS